MRKYLLPILGLLLAGIMALPQDAHAAPTLNNPESWSPRQMWEGKPLTWAPCRTITYTVNDETYATDLRIAMQRATWKTGIRFALAAPGAPADLDVNFSFNKDNPQFVALVATAYADVDRYEESGGAWYYSHATIAVKNEDMRQMRPWNRKTVLMHELGHVLGLGHVADPTQIMFNEAGLTRRRWNAGDIAGFQALYPQPC